MSGGEWLLDLDVDGATYRYATRTVEVTDAHGHTYMYRAGLSDFAMRLNGVEREQGVEIIDPSINWAQLIARGVTIDGRPARLLYWTPGTVLHAARVVLAGVAQAPQYGFPGAPGRLVVSVVERGALLYPAPAEAVTNETFTYTPNVLIYDDPIAGQVYPTVFGHPGANETVEAEIGTDGAIPATPALLCYYDGTAGSGHSHVMTCRGNTATAAAGGTVNLFDADNTNSIGAIEVIASDSRAVATDTDLLGRTYSRCEFTSPVNDVTPISGHRYYVAWRSTGGGLTLDGSSPIRSLTDVALWALRHSGQRVDLQAQESQRASLDQFAVDGFVNQRIETVDWFERTIVPLFPLVRSRTSRGLYWRFIDWDATTVAAIQALNADRRQVTRVSPLQVARDQVRNVYALQYARNAITGSYFGRRLLSGQAETLPSALVTDGILTSDRVIGSPLCAASIARYGIIEAAQVQSEYVWQDSQAGLILHHWAARDAQPRVFVSYEGRDLAHLARGDVVALTDSEIGVSSAAALVDAVQLSGRRFQRVDLEILDRTVRAT